MANIWNCPVPDPNFDANQAARQAVFAKIANPDNWKMPIAAWIARADFDDCEQAAMFFTGSRLRVSGYQDGRVFVEAPGYYRTVGA